jgi:hypothetical protein
MSVLVLTIAVVAGISAVVFADKSVASFSLAPLYFLPLALSALAHPLRICLGLSIVCLSGVNYYFPSGFLIVAHQFVWFCMTLLAPSGILEPDT